MKKESDSSSIIINKIAGALLFDYISVYYVNAITNEYQEYSVDTKNHSLIMEKEGQDFFDNMAKNAEWMVYEDDRRIFQRDIQKENLIYQMQIGAIRSIRYRLMVDGKPVYHIVRLIREMQKNDEYFIFGVQNIENEIKREENEKELKKERDIFNRIAESLTANFDIIYYVNIENDHYLEFISKQIFSSPELPEEGEDFWTDVANNAEYMSYPEDKSLIKSIFKKSFLLSVLRQKKVFSSTYRLFIDGNIQHTRFTAGLSSDKTHFILGIENINEEFEKEKEYLSALRLANEEARRDEMTGIKNKFAYHELEQSMQNSIENGVSLQFAIVVCDLNNLKQINDMFGHNAGDKYIKDASALICDIFSHSPVFRIGGDEFVAVLTDRDYYDRERLFKMLRFHVSENQKSGTGPVLASGMAAFDTCHEKKVSEVFVFADRNMYENKKYLKEIQPNISSHEEFIEQYIPENQKKRLDSLFEALSMISTNASVYLCNMRYDYSRWAKSIVEHFELPSEYMYAAGVLWEKYIHPDDLEKYRKGVQAVFVGTAAGLDLSYRVRKPDGSYILCSSQGIVIRDEKEEPVYFAGLFRNLI